MTQASSLDNLRYTVDYFSTEPFQSYGTSDLPYLEAVLRRLQWARGDRQAPVDPRVTDDTAVRVVTTEEWTLANQARLTAEAQRQEIEAMRSHLDSLSGREDDLKSEIDRLTAELEAARNRGDEIVPLELVGVRDTQGETETLLEFETDTPPQRRRDYPEAVAWEESDAPVTTGEKWTDADTADDEWAPVDQESSTEQWEEAPRWVEAPGASPGAAHIEGEINEIQEEIRRIEEELALIAAQERELEARGVPTTRMERTEAALAQTMGDQPYTTKGYTLFAKQIQNPDGSTRPFHFFAKDTQRADATAVPLPPEYKVATNARTGMPYLKKKAAKSKRKSR
jgi:archaellum component FlaC